MWRQRKITFQCDLFLVRCIHHSIHHAPFKFHRACMKLKPWIILPMATLTVQVKVKVPLANFCPVVFNSRGWCSSPFPSHRASVLPKDNLPWSHGQCDLYTEHCYLPTEVVPIYLLAFACFRTARLAVTETKWRELTPLRGFDLTTAGLLTLQHRLLRFSPQRHHIPHILQQEFFVYACTV